MNHICIHCISWYLKLWEWMRSPKGRNEEGPGTSSGEFSVERLGWEEELVKQTEKGLPGRKEGN